MNKLNEHVSYYDIVKMNHYSTDELEIMNNRTIKTFSHICRIVGYGDITEQNLKYHQLKKMLTADLLERGEIINKINFKELVEKQERLNKLKSKNKIFKKYGRKK
ncbi:hypothetical protein [Metaclostridioides mangenotii]|uniref:hypothetical protein n=1 Tax=Metaclostridioides mangenotii TaxID=1540 RepID=UPI0004633B0B|nr:hypothetical protein [Clostridioides mangenotii]